MPAYKTKRTPNPNTTQIIQTTVLPGQKSAPGGNLLNYLFRVIPAWMNPQWTDALLWRNFVLSIPAAVLFRDTAISNLCALEWKIVPRKSQKQDTLQSDIDYYTALFLNDGEYDGLDWVGRLEWMCKDLLDLPFGSAVEVGREDDSPQGKVVWLRALDGGTLMPTLNSDYPVIQRVPNMPTEPIAFPKWSISRMYMSPRSDIWKEGWGMAPPESIYLAMELLRRGDKYYAELLLNTPEAGILDLGDMEQDTAMEWVENARQLFVGVDPWKIPVLYEHTSEIKWIPFTNRPNEIMYDEITSRYIAMVGAGYGMSPSDIGLGGAGSNGGDTMAGTIRQERSKKYSLQASLKRKVKHLYDVILPSDLEFSWVDYDEESLISRGRAWLAYGQADQLMIGSGVFSAQELRTQHIQDGLVTVSIPETLPPELKNIKPGGDPTKHNELLGEPVSTNMGGRGDISQPPSTTIRSALQKLAKVAVAPMGNFVGNMKDMTEEERTMWTSCLADPFWWQGADEHVVQIMEGLRKKVNGSIKHSPAVAFSYADDDTSVVSTAIQQKALTILDEEGVDADESELLAHCTNVSGYLKEAAQASSDIMTELLTTELMTRTVDAITKFGIDFQPLTSDNKRKVVQEVTDGLSEAYEKLSDAARYAGQEILTKHIDTEADNVAKVFLTAVRDRLG